VVTAVTSSGSGASLESHVRGAPRSDSRGAAPTASLGFPRMKTAPGHPEASKTSPQISLWKTCGFSEDISAGVPKGRPNPGQFPAGRTRQNEQRGPERFEPPITIPCGGRLLQSEDIVLLPPALLPHPCAICMAFCSAAVRFCALSTGSQTARSPNHTTILVSMATSSAFWQRTGRVRAVYPILARLDAPAVFNEIEARPQRVADELDTDLATRSGHASSWPARRPTTASSVRRLL